jgi:hypothetical protein
MTLTTASLNCNLARLYFYYVLYFVQTTKTRYNYTVYNVRICTYLLFMRPDPDTDAVIETSKVLLHQEILNDL